MKKQILNLGKRLNREDLQQVKGGRAFLDCNDFCNSTRPENRDDYIQHQLLRYGLDWSHCVC